MTGTLDITPVAFGGDHLILSRTILKERETTRIARKKTIFLTSSVLNEKGIRIISIAKQDIHALIECYK